MRQGMATGDLRNNLGRLQAAVRSMRMEDSVDWQGCGVLEGAGGLLSHTHTLSLSLSVLACMCVHVYVRPPQHTSSFQCGNSVCVWGGGIHVHAFGVCWRSLSLSLCVHMYVCACVCVCVRECVYVCVNVYLPSCLNRQDS